MILVIMAICVALIICGYIWWDTGICAGVGLIGGAISLIVLISLMYNIVHSSVLDDQIAMYQEENTKIEMELAECVEHYMAHEEKIMTEVDPESAITLVALYPELKSDILVSYLMDTHISNSDQIKELRAQLLTVDSKRWWLYFGGNGVDW